MQRKLSAAEVKQGEARQIARRKREKALSKFNAAILKKKADEEAKKEQQAVINKAVHEATEELRRIGKEELDSLKAAHEKEVKKLKDNNVAAMSALVEDHDALVTSLEADIAKLSATLESLKLDQEEKISRIKRGLNLEKEKALGQLKETLDLKLSKVASDMAELREQQKKDLHDMDMQTMRHVEKVREDGAAMLRSEKLRHGEELAQLEEKHEKELDQVRKDHNAEVAHIEFVVSQRILRASGDTPSSAAETPEPGSSTSQVVELADRLAKKSHEVSKIRAKVKQLQEDKEVLARRLKDYVPRTEFEKLKEESAVTVEKDKEARAAAEAMLRETKAELENLKSSSKKQHEELASARDRLKGRIAMDPDDSDLFQKFQAARAEGMVLSARISDGALEITSTEAIEVIESLTTRVEELEQDLCGSLQSSRKHPRQRDGAQRNPRRAKSGERRTTMMDYFSKYSYMPSVVRALAEILEACAELSHTLILVRDVPRWHRPTLPGTGCALCQHFP